MSGHCKDCKWWDDVLEDHGICWLAETREGKTVKGTLFYATHTESVMGDYHSGSYLLVTAPEFGCVQFSEAQVNETAPAEDSMSKYVWNATPDRQPDDEHLWRGSE